MESTTDLQDGPLEPGTPEAFWAASVRCHEIADEYRAIADAVAKLSDSVRVLNNATVADPDDFEFDQTKPGLLRSDIARADAARNIDRLESSVIHLHGRAGVWDSQAGKYRERGTELLQEQHADAGN